MKKILLIFIMTIMSAAVAVAQNKNKNNNDNRRDVIYLQSGSTVKGQVIDKKADGTVRVRTGDGHIYQFEGKEVQRIEKEETKTHNPSQQQQNDTPPPPIGGNRNRNRHNPNRAISQQNQYQSRQSDRHQTYKNKQKDKSPITFASEGYRWFVEAGFLPGVTCSDGYDEEFTSRILGATTHGYQMSEYTFLGGGIGVQYMLHRKEVAVLPYIDFRYDFYAELNSPFLNARAGGYIHNGGSGGFFNACVGYHFSRVSLTAGYELAPYKYLTTSAKSFYEDTKYYSSFLIKVSMDWGGR